MVRGLYTAASGLLTQEMRLEVTTNNLANVATEGYRPDRAVVHDFNALLLHRLYDPIETPFRPNLRIDPMPTIGRLGTGSYVHEIHTDFDAQGPIEMTKRPLDLAIDGTGFFALNTPQGVRYTRAGRFVRDANDFVVNEDGHQLMGQNGPIRLPPGANLDDLHIDGDGNVAIGQTPIDRLVLVNVLPGPVREGYTLNGAQKVGYNLVDAVTGTAPVDPTQTRVQQGAIEHSPVNVVREMVGLIEVQRTYEANQKVVLAEDESLDRVLQRISA